MDPWERYAEIVEDPAAFRRACQRPLPTAVRVNPVKADPPRVIDALRDEGIGVETRKWSEHALLLETDSPGRTWPYQHGWIHGQEEISQFPARVLDPEPDDSVWDAAAAPGGKATQLAAATDPEGFVVANDVNLGRITALRANADRLGITNMAVTHRDAREFSLDGFGMTSFDRVLVDAPCSGEGTVRKNPDVRREWIEERIHGLVELQKAMLGRAVRLTRPGGTVVYSTCTFAPEENEGVLSAIRDTAPCRIVPFETRLESRAGVREWQGEVYHPEVAHARRFYPHHNDTGGFVCAKLEVAA